MTWPSIESSELYPFQRRVVELVSGGQNVILQAPTGAGKTLAALWPFVSRGDSVRRTLRHCLYAVPMRVLANQFADAYAPPGLDVKLQTGESPHDRRFEADISYATIDQVLSSYLMAPYSLPRRLANLNAAAVASSYLILDEFHLFGAQDMLPTTLEMLRALRGMVPFVLMTATFSTTMLDALARELGAIVVPGDAQETEALAALPSQQKERLWRLVERPLAANSILENHNKRALVVCNTVGRAQRLYHDLIAAAPQARVLLLHSRFLPVDRARIEAELVAHFGKDAPSHPERPVVAVATQVIEVGMDLTCDALHTELAPANALIQRAGRCARYKGESGTVYVYAQGTAADGSAVDLREHTLPYQGSETLCVQTAKAIVAIEGKAASFSDEQALISAVHGIEDQRVVEGLRATRQRHRLAMDDVMRGAQPPGRLIRQSLSQPIVIHAEPEQVAAEPYAYEGFALHPGTVRGMVKSWLAQTSDDAAPVWTVRDEGDTDESGRSTLACKPVRRPADATGIVVVVHPKMASYDPDQGFLPDQGGVFQSPRASDAQIEERPASSYRLEAYSDHVTRVTEAMGLVWPSLDGAAEALEQREGWPVGVLAELARAIAIAHDAGKLANDWQRWATTYQAALGQPAPEGFWAHTQWDPVRPACWEAERAAGRRPPHAVEGAIMVAPLLSELASGNDTLLRAAFSAIARHHGAFSREVASYQLSPGAVSALTEVWERHLGPAGARPIADGTGLAGSAPRMLADPARTAEHLAYAILARALRLADQAGTAMGADREEGM